MPFSKRRRGRGLGRYRNQRITIPLTQQMVPPPANFNGSGAAYGITDSSVVSVPTDPTGDLEVAGNTFAETPVSQTIGTYNFNFSRLLAHTIGGSESGNPLYILSSWFRRLRFSTGYMTIERIDNGITARYVSTSFVVPGGFPNTGEYVPLLTAYADPKPVPLDIYYLRLSSHESTFDQAMLAPAVFRADPRCRRVRLMPGKSVTFKFRALRFRPANYLVSTLRDMASALGQETDQYRRAELPSRPRKMGWVPSNMVVRERPLVPGLTAGGQGGLGADVFDIVSPTIGFHFDVPQIGEAILPGTQSAILNGAHDGPAQNLCRSILIRRREFCSVSLAGFVPPVQKLGAPYVGVSGVGQILRTTQWNTGNTSYNTVELFDPPKLTSLAPQVTANYALWRPGQVFSPSVFLQTSVPLDLEVARQSDKAPPTIPGVGAVP